MTNTMPNTLTVAEVASLLGYKESTLKVKLYSKGKSKLPPLHKAGNKLFFLRDEVESWFISQPVINK